MPAPLNVDREAVKAHAITHGVREAARAFRLKEATVMQWSARGGWLKPVETGIPGQPPIPPVPTTMQKQVVSGVSTASEAARKTLESQGEKAKSAVAKAVVKGFEAVADMEGEDILSRAGDMKALAGTAQAINLPGFERDSHGQAAFLGLHVTIRPDAGRAIDVDAEVIPAPDSQG